MHAAAKCSSGREEMQQPIISKVPTWDSHHSVACPVCQSHIVSHWQGRGMNDWVLISKKRGIKARAIWWGLKYFFFFVYSNVSCWAWRRPCVSSSQPARGSLWAPGIGGRGLGRLVRVTPGGASLSFLHPVLGYTSGGTPVTLCSQSQKPYHLPYIILRGIISQHCKETYTRVEHSVQTIQI